MLSPEEQKTRLLVGLGNPGREYANTRHNAGFIVADAVEKILSGKWEEKVTGRYVLKAGRCRGDNLWIMKPVTFMNLSGKAVFSFMGENGLSAKEVLLIYDDLDLPLGKIRFSDGGGSAGHRGVESVIESLVTADFARLRIGIGKSMEVGDGADYVLSDFSGDEKKIFLKVVEIAAEAVKLFLHRGLVKVMNKYNGCTITNTGIDDTKRNKIIEPNKINGGL